MRCCKVYVLRARGKVSSERERENLGKQDNNFADGFKEKLVVKLVC